MNQKCAKDTVVKTVVRNTEVKINKNKKVFENSNIPINQKSCSSTEQPKIKGILKNAVGSENSLAYPALNSTEKVIKQIEELNRETQKLTNTNSLVDKKKIDKTGKHQNFNFNERLYKDLLALNLNDRNVPSCPKAQIPQRKFTPNQNKDLEPRLEDFHENVEKLDKPVMVSGVRIKCSPLFIYDSHDLYDKVNSWKS